MKKTSKKLVLSSGKNKVAQVFQLSPGTVFEIKPNGRYLIILPENAELKYIEPAIKDLFGDAKVLVLAARDVSQIKIAELLNEK